MRKVLTVAKAEYFIAVTSKAFLIGIALMPLFMGGAILVQFLTRDQVDLTPRKLAVVDQTGVLFDAISRRADQRNTLTIFDGEGDDRKQVRAKFVVEQVELAPETEGDKEALSKLGVSLSDRVRDGDLFAFAVIDRDVIASGGQGEIRYHSQTPSYFDLSNWLEFSINQEIKLLRSQKLGLTPENVLALTSNQNVRQFGLVEVDQSGKDQGAKEENRLLTFAVPTGGLMLMFMMIMSVAPTMLNNVLEEKMQKISEFLVSSISPFQLMLGKLLGAIAVGLTLSTIYLGAAYSLTRHFEISQDVPTTLYLWFVFFLLLALVIFGSIFSAIGAACSEIRDAQSLMTPVMLLVIIPLMCLGPVIDSPNSTFARAISLFPPATPMLMFVRIALPPGPETWEIVLATVFTVVFALVCVWAAGKVFRVGILSQGQAPSFAKLIRWVISS